MKKHIIPIALFITSILVWLITYSKLPAQLPTHWGINGEANSYSSKLTAFLMIHGIMLVIYAILLAVPKIDPKKADFKSFSKSYSFITLAILVVFYAISMGVIYIGLGHELNVGKMIGLLLGAMFIVLGNYLPQVKPNYMVGIKTPWTLSNETVWKKTHRFGAKLFVISGILMMISWFLPANWIIVTMIIAILIISVIPIVYSYVIHKKIVNN